MLSIPRDRSMLFTPVHNKSISLGIDVRDKLSLGRPVFSQSRRFHGEPFAVLSGVGERP